MHLLAAILLSVNFLTSHPITGQANMSVLVQNLNTGEVIDNYRSEHVVPPASVMKLLTTGAALEILGPGFRFPTLLEYSGYVENGTLHGNLYIHGGCDPSLGWQGQTAFLYQWVKAVQQAGIKRIDGGVVADMTMLDGEAQNPSWLCEDAGNYYAPGIFALNYYGNTMNIVLKSGEPGSVASVVKTEPAVEDVYFINHIRCGKITYDGAFVSGLPFSRERYLTGAVPSNLGTFGVKGDLPNPGLLLARHFTNRLREAGISVKNEANYEADYNPLTTARTELYIHYSEPLSEIIKDGCGLAPQDAVSAKTFVQLLTIMSRSTNQEAWLASLPVSGQSGTLKSLCPGTPLEGRIHAKSGTIAGTKNFAGYIDMPNGETWVFAILINSAPGKAKNIQTVIQQYLLDVYKAHQ